MWGKEPADMKKRMIALLLALLLTVPGVVSATTYYYVNTSWLAARSAPSVQAERVDSYRRDFALTIAQRVNKTWAKVRFRPSGNTAYVQTRYIKASQSYTAYLSQDDTRVYTGPATSFNVLGVLNKGAKVTVLTHGKAFDFVSTSYGKGYIRNTHLTKTKPAGVTAFIRNPRNRTVNLRAGAGKSYKVLGEYRPGTKITLLKKNDVWSKVSVRGKTGYMMTRYISLK